MPGASPAPVPSRGEAPRLSGASTRALAVASIRLALGAAGIGGALARGLGAAPAFGAALAGVVILFVIGLGQRSRSGLTPEPKPLPAPTDAEYDPPWLAALLACIPSTLGVAALTGVALGFSPALAAVLAGVLLGLGSLALVAGAQLVARERREGVRYWVERGPRPRLFVNGARP